jgi:hypothetical protein
VSVACCCTCRRGKPARWLHTQDELAEAAQFCELLVTGAVAEAADPAARAARFPLLHAGQLAVALSRYREADAHSFSLGRHHPRMPQELIKKRAVDVIVKKLRAEAAASAAAQSKP